MLTTPPTQLIEPADPAVSPSPVPARPTLAAVPGVDATVPAHGPAAGAATADQAERAVLQPQERPGETAVEQVQAVLQELGLTVAPARP